MATMTRDKITSLEQHLYVDRANWVCSAKNTDFALKDWASLRVKNFGLLNNALKSKKVCSFKNKNWDNVLQVIESLVISPEMENIVEGVQSWLDVISYEHSRYLFDQYSINDHGKNVRNFNLFSFGNKTFFITVGNHFNM